MPKNKLWGLPQIQADLELNMFLFKSSNQNFQICVIQRRDGEWAHKAEQERRRIFVASDGQRAEKRNRTTQNSSSS